MRRRRFIAAGFGSIALGSGATQAAHAPQHKATALAFGTTVGITLRHPDEQVARRAIDDALAAVRKVEGLMSIYDPDSQVYRLNRDGFLARPDPHLLAVLRHARDLSRLTAGAFDITVQPLWQAGRRAFDAGILPSPAERERARALVGWNLVDAASERVMLRKPGMRITLNGLAQGYAADLALRAVRARGVVHALLDTGEFAAHGDAGGRDWQLGVPDPRVPGRVAAAVRVDGRCVATSGDYEAAFTSDRMHHHIFDPATGDSPLELASVTVLAPTAIEADGLSTAFMVLGSRCAHALAARLPGVDLLTIDKLGRKRCSPFLPQAL
ncbi:FAD:protein FMN transferase [Massilia sp. Mn16-1_5]|uniref:FAD:protein FMN transferase n=1 Tax=Massilia sp. Mn16-1_5 TaxID=2079199 RepID=UPI00109E7D91|nr:FAD:protein FMN transferase [Massilia sp. Mn16-1_5]THC45478.1 thiamine biosynthesis protein ApbE [Massilia sp. Mn16-1_5]